jgi:hypothetical protein
MLKIFKKVILIKIYITTTIKQSVKNRKTKNKKIKKKN